MTGYQSKKAMAQAKVEGPLHVVCQCDKCKAQPAQEPVAWGVDWGKAGDIPCVSIIKRLPNGGIEVVAVEYAPYTFKEKQT